MSQLHALTAKPADLPLAPAPSVASSPMLALLSDAIQKGMSIEVIREIKAMAKEFEADARRAAFDEAVSNAKAELKPIVRTRDGHNSKYADFAAVADAVDPIISKYGLSYRHRSIVEGGRITVVCKLSHKAGHFEETELPAPPDKTGSKNEIQAIGSTLTYLQRYTVLLALGLATAHDDDGRSANTLQCLSEDQALNLNDLIDSAIDQVGAKREVYLKNFLNFMKVDSVSDIRVGDYQKAVDGIKSTLGAGK